MHEGLFDAESESGLPIRIAFAGLWCAADREGRFKWEPRKLGIQILPWDGCDFSRVLDALTTRGFVVKYTCGTDVFGWIPSFQKHQVVNNRERLSELPNPLECNQIDASTTRASRVDHAEQGEGKGREGNKEGKGGGRESPPPLDFPQPKEEPFNPNRIAKFEDVMKMARNQMPPISDECAEAFFDRMEADGWINNQGHPLADWRPRFRLWATAWAKNANAPNRK